MPAELSPEIARVVTICLVKRVGKQEYQLPVIFPEHPGTLGGHRTDMSTRWLAETERAIDKLTAIGHSFMDVAKQSKELLRWARDCKAVLERLIEPLSFQVPLLSLRVR